MKAWVLNGINDIQYEDREIPESREGEVLVKVRAAGICGSDIPRVFETGAHTHPLVPGHEFSGIVEDVGKGAEPSWRGKRVGIFPLIPCKKCDMCKDQKYEMCRNYNYLGSRCDGGFAEYTAVPMWNLMELPHTASFEQAAMLEPMAVAVHAIRRAFGPEKSSDRITGESLDREQTIVIIGLGTIGLLTAMFLHSEGFTNLLLIGNKDFQKKMAYEIGFSEGHFCNIKRQDASEWILEKTDGKGADTIFECVGKNDSISFAIDHTAASGTVILIGNPHDETIRFERDVYWKILRRQLTVRGTWNSSFRHETDDDWNCVIRMLDKGSIIPEKLISERLPLHRLDEGLQLMHEKLREYCKVMIVNP